MAKQTVNIGTVPDDNTGDPLRTAFDKLNDNCDEIYAAAVEPDYFYFTGRSYRIGERGGILCIDKIITPMGFDVGAVEGINWNNVAEFTL